MEALRGSCAKLAQVLVQVEERCQITLADLDRFNNFAASYARFSLVRTLAILSFWVSGVAKSLYREHGGQGYVCVFLSECEGIHSLWVEREEIVANRERFRAYGSTVLSVEEIVDIIEQRIRELDSGKWAKVVDWLDRYGKSPGLDFDKFSEIEVQVTHSETTG